MGSQIISYFNQLLSVLILFLWSFVFCKASPCAARRGLITPTVKLENPASTSAVISVKGEAESGKSLNAQPLTLTAPVPWGTTEKIADHLYRTYVENDPAMGTPEEILSALNIYRKNHNRGELRSDENICKLANWRTQEQQKAGNLDSHKGLVGYMNDPNHWKELDIKAIGENASYGYTLSGTHLIEWVFDSDVEHRDNQLNPSWNLACAGTSGVTVDILFGQR